MMFVLITLFIGVLWWHQRRLAAQAVAWGNHLLDAQDQERQRIARDLHDDVVQRLFSAQLYLERDDAERAREIIGDASSDLRSMARELFPHALEHLTMAEALRELAELQPHDAPATTIDADEAVTLPLPASVALYRVAQEALHNARKHSKALHIACTLSHFRGWVELTITDDGVGFTSDERSPRSFGLRTVRERVTAVGGTMEIQSPFDGAGSRIVARVPGP